MTVRSALVVAALMVVCLGRAPAAAQRPNIVFILTDDQRNDTLSCAGHPIVKTPNIDRLAAQGVRFENAFVSHSICWVSRTTLLTGLTARSFGLPNTPDAAKPEVVEKLCPDYLHEAGYRTGFFGKWHAKMPQRLSSQPNSISIVYKPTSLETRISRKQPDGSENGTKPRSSGICAVSTFCESQKDDKPFCLNLWFNAARMRKIGDKRPGIGHFPVAQVGRWYVRRDQEMPRPRLERSKQIYDSQPKFLKAVAQSRPAILLALGHAGESTKPTCAPTIRMISGIDNVVGRVQQTLEDRGLADNTIVVYSADNGYYMGDRGFAGKWSHYEQSLRVPMIVADPRLPKSRRGKVEQGMALNLDLPSTFLDWAGVAIPKRYQGRSLRAAVERGTPADWREDFFCEHVTLAPTLTWEGVRGSRYVYARYFDQQPASEFLHDLKSDPDQLKNLAGDAAHAETLDKMRARCDALVERYGGPLAPLAQRRRRR